MKRLVTEKLITLHNTNCLAAIIAYKKRNCIIRELPTGHWISKQGDFRHQEVKISELLQWEEEFRNTIREEYRLTLEEIKTLEEFTK